MGPSERAECRPTLPPNWPPPHTLAGTHFLQHTLCNTLSSTHLQGRKTANLCTHLFVRRLARRLRSASGSKQNRTQTRPVHCSGGPSGGKHDIYAPWAAVCAKIKWPPAHQRRTRDMGSASADCLQLEGHACARRPRFAQAGRPTRRRPTQFPLAARSHSLADTPLGPSAAGHTLVRKRAVNSCPSWRTQSPAARNNAPPPSWPVNQAQGGAEYCRLRLALDGAARLPAAHSLGPRAEPSWRPPPSKQRPGKRAVVKWCVPAEGQRGQCAACD